MATPAQAVIEIAAAAIGAAMGIAASGLSGMLRRDDQAAAATCPDNRWPGAI